MLGVTGNVLLLLAIVASLLALYGFYRATGGKTDAASWLKTARISWFGMTAALVASAIILWILIFSHQFQYSYVWSYTSRSLPFHFLLSAFWAGQEGSFLLWILFTAIIGLVLIRRARDYEAHVMVIVALCQAFMLTMILGLHLGPIKIGSSPFMTLAERFPDADFIQTGGVPPDGNGLNALLQNVWMAIHPPTLFVGFAALVVPFAYAIAGLWKREYSEWVKPALPWAVFANLVLMMGILMGGYWAYVTLSFGGYWSWDPVENSSLVPWLVGVAGIHAMLIQQRKASSPRAALVLNILAFILVVYSTFLTRSGILGDISVHSFVDLGLYNQLVIWIASMAGVGMGLFAMRFRELPVGEKTTNWLSREFLIFSGAMLLCVLAGVIILGTSTPIIGRIFRDSPSGVPIEFYNKWTLPVAILILLLIGLGQLVWWTKMKIETVNRVVLAPLAASVLSTGVVLIFTPFAEATVRHVAGNAGHGSDVFAAGIGENLGRIVGIYGMSIMLLLLMFMAFFAFYGNLIVAWRIAKGNVRLAGGALSHIGFAMMLLGVITSSAFNNPLSESSEPIRRADGSVGERGNFIIEEGQTLDVEGYRVTYTGRETSRDGHTEYHLTFLDDGGRSFEARPVAFKSNEIWVQNPYIKAWFEKDLFIAVSPNEMFGEEDPGAGQISMTRGESFDLSDRFRVTFEDFEMDAEAMHSAESGDIRVAARLNLLNKDTGESRMIRPVYIILADRTQHYQSGTFDDWDVTVSFTGMNVDSGSIRLVFEGEGLENIQPDWILVQAYEKPFINLLWVGSIILLFGFGIAFYRRLGDSSTNTRAV